MTAIKILKRLLLVIIFIPVFFLFMAMIVPVLVIGFIITGDRIEAYNKMCDLFHNTTQKLIQ